jgi:hypothetical protein
MMKSCLNKSECKWKLAARNGEECKRGEEVEEEMVGQK